MGSVYVIAGEKTQPGQGRVYAQEVSWALISPEEQAWKLLRGRVTTPDVQLQNIYAIVWLIKRFNDLMKVGLR